MSKPIDPESLLTELHSFSPDTQVLVGYFDRMELLPLSASASVNPDEVISLRAFNDSAELYAWRSNNILKARLRSDAQDPDAENCDSADCTMAIDHVLQKNGEPFQGYKKIVFRNYAKSTPDGQLYYFDSRIVKLIK